MTPTIPESERGLLAAAIVDPSQLARVADIVAPADFADPDLGRLFEALQQMHDAGLPIGDALVLVPELKRLQIPESVRTPAFLGRLVVDGGAHSPHAVFYAQQVRRAATLRRLQALGQTLAVRASDAGADPADITAWLDAQLSGLGHHIPDPPRLVDDLAAELLTQLREPHHGGGILTGLPSHDLAAGGWMRGELIVLAARPGVGKTSLAMQIAWHNVNEGRPVLFVSLEMTGRELVARILCGLAGVDSRRLRSAALDSANLKKMQQAAVQVGGLPLRVWSPPMATAARIRGVAKQAAATDGLDLLVVDYIGLVRPADSRRPRHEQIGEVSASLKALAKELSCPVLALCQLNREADGYEPRLSHLRDSGSIEQDADIVLFVHRDDTDKSAARLIVAKHRHGDTGSIPLIWDAARTRYEDPTGQIVNRQ